jgi:23S rRNA pseudouridine2605 synthase
MRRKTIPSESTGEPIRLARFLAMSGVGSRRHCEEYIVTGRVTVDRETVTDLGRRIDPATQKVCLDGERIKPQRHVYFMLNKPVGVLCTHHDPQGRPRVIDLFPGIHERLFTVGRLDESSSGLLIVTNDGALAQHLAHPRFRVPKVYRVLVAGVPSDETLRQIQDGLYFAEGRFQAHTARRLRVKGQSSVLELTLLEGQNREIRRLLARAGHKVMRLERVALGPLRLGDLAPGEYRPLFPPELAALREIVAERGSTRPRRNRKAAGRRTSAGSRRSAGRASRGNRRRSSHRELPEE